MAISTRTDLRISDVVSKYWVCNRTGRTNGHTQIGTIQVFPNAFATSEKEQLVLDDWPPEGSAELFTLEAIEGFSVRCGGGQRL